MQKLLQDIPRRETSTTTPVLTSDHDNSCRNLLYRCGIPCSTAFLDLEDKLFFDYVYSTSYETTTKRFLTSFAIRRDIFRGFFGDTEDSLRSSSKVLCEEKEYPRGLQGVIPPSPTMIAKFETRGHPGPAGSSWFNGAHGRSRPAGSFWFNGAHGRSRSSRKPRSNRSSRIPRPSWRSRSVGNSRSSRQPRPNRCSSTTPSKNSKPSGYSRSFGISW